MFDPSILLRTEVTLIFGFLTRRARSWIAGALYAMSDARNSSSDLLVPWSYVSCKVRKLSKFAVLGEPQERVHTTSMRSSFSYRRASGVTLLCARWDE